MQIKVIAKAVEDTLWDGNRDELRGVLKVAKMILTLPAQLTKSEETLNQLETNQVEDFKSLTIQLVRETLDK